MIWLFVCALIFAGETRCQSIFQTGGALPSDFLNPDGLSFLNEITNSAKAAQKEQGIEFIWAVLRLLGVEPGRVKDLAFDGVMSMVHLLSQTLLKDSGNVRTGRTSLRNSLFRFILSQPQVAGLLKQMQDPKLVDKLLKETNFENVDCIRLLICKTHPFVRGMQRSLEFFMRREGIRAPGGDEACPVGGDDASWDKASLESRMYFFLPGLEEVIAHGEECDQLFPACEY